MTTKNNIVRGFDCPNRFSFKSESLNIAGITKSAALKLFKQVKGSIFESFIVNGVLTPLLYITRERIIIN